MKRLYVWEWIMVLISGVAYFIGLGYGFKQQEAIIIATLVSLAAALVATFCFESIIVVMVAFGAITGVYLITFGLPFLTVGSLFVGLIGGASFLSVKYIIDSRDEIDYHKFFGSLIIEFAIIFVVLKYGYLLWNYWQKF